MIKAVVDTRTFRRQLERHGKEADRLAYQILDRVGKATVEHLRSFTDEVLPGGRRAHPGGWGDVSGDTARGYEYEVKRGKSGWILVLRNVEESAVFLEAMDGLFVLSGVTEKGGPVDTALHKAVREIAPGWRLR